MDLAVITVTDDQFLAAEAFARARISHSEALYRSRGEEQLQKMIEDITTGTLAEFAVCDYLRSQGYECTDPDISIHTKRSFSADLKVSEPRGSSYLVHVKSQTKEQAERYSASWIFQVEDKALSLPNENGYGLFCIVDNLTVHIKAAVWLIDIIEAEAISKPKNGRYALYKDAVYLADLINKNVNIRRF